MPEASIVRNINQNRQRLLVYILDEIVTMDMLFLIYQQYQSNLLPSVPGSPEIAPGRTRRAPAHEG